MQMRCNERDLLAIESPRQRPRAFGLLTEAQFNVAPAFCRVALGERCGAISASVIQILPEIENSLFGCCTTRTHTSLLGVPGLEGDQLGIIWLLQTKCRTTPISRQLQGCQENFPQEPQKQSQPSPSLLCA